MHATAFLAAKNNCLAAKNKCLAESNRTRTESKATNKRLHLGRPRCRRGRAQSCRRGIQQLAPLPLWRGPTSYSCAHPNGEKELPPMPRSKIEIYWNTADTAPDGVIAQVMVTDDSGSDYVLLYPCELTKDGWVNAASGKPLAVRV